jgi:hypothetical protein
MTQQINIETILRENQDKLKFPGGMMTAGGPDESYVGVTVAIAGVLFFEGAHLPEVREAVCKCFDEFQAAAKDQLKWLWREEPPEGPAKLDYAKAPALRDMVKRMQPDDLLSFLYHSGDKSEDAGEWNFFVSGRRAWQAKMRSRGPSSLRFSVPLVYVLNSPAAFQQLFVSFADKLKAMHGYGGYSLMLSEARRHENEAFEAWLVPQANGLDAGHPVLLSRYLVDKIKTVSWLTAISNDMLAKVGGVQTLYSELPRDWFACYPYSNGLVIQAGPTPNAAGVQVDPKPAAYVLPNMLFKELRADAITSLHTASVSGEPKLTGAAAKDWIQRFDVPESELMAYRRKLLDEPKLTKETTLPVRL